MGRSTSGARHYLGVGLRIIEFVFATYDFKFL